METILAFVIGALYAAAFYLMMRRSLVKLVLGLMIFGHAVHLLIFTSAGLTDSRPPFIVGAGQALEEVADPLPQALILTSIVISFGVLAFTLALVRRAGAMSDSEDLDDMREDDE